MFKILMILVVLFCLKAFSIDKNNQREDQDLDHRVIKIQNTIE